MKKQLLLYIVLLLVLPGCQPAQPAPTPTLTAAPTPTSIPPHWMEYEKALAKAVVNTEEALCEWRILGQAEQEVYVWALCKVKAPIGSAGSVPAVIKLAENGEIEEVIIPRDGSYYPVDVRALFPSDIQEQVFHPALEGWAAGEHIAERLKTNGPPLIALQETPLP